MFDPTFLTRTKLRNRKGAVLPLFALMLPVILILCGFAINMAYMQLVATEMKVSTDVSSHAAGRALSEAQREIVTNVSPSVRREQIVQATYDAIETASKWNDVGGKQLSIRLDDRDVHFGYSVRPPDEMYQFTQVPVSQIKSGAERASSVGVKGRINIPLVFQSMNISKFTPERRSIATQVDRDIALVLDRSGSMLYYKDMADLDETLEELYNDVVQVRRLRYNYKKGYYYYEYYNERRISYDDYVQALGYYQSKGKWRRADPDIYERNFTSDVRNEMYDYWTRSSEQEHKDMYEFMYDWEQYATSWNNGFKTKAPRHSRWSFLVLGVEAFLDVLGGTTDGLESGTDQKELVALVTFDSTARVDTALTDDDIKNGGVAYYQNIRNIVADIVPLNGTGIGEGLATGLPPIADPDWAQNNNMSGAVARPFAEKTIIVLTDGIPSSGTANPVTTVQNLVHSNAVTIHTVTFTPDADKVAMQSVADEGGGKHYHADTGDFLVTIFKEVANNLPTILTE
ncbi:vWA domain-containing protein [Mariniblastus fucicola]|uniref:von Willebrand factor type A domain protein n=1 Tax=Mariniblastus fucicola TaxID=980251 RepID=A0A5B9P2U9_9BACT|nr:VWA domain-containing protein [Mariniblastus fucicola]QEG20857.1 von Willebrand factor type A domain protein [Mariniblastus fucicola]